MEKLATGLAGRQQWEAAIGHARRWSALDPLHEPAQRLLMQLHAWAGDRAAAVRQYQECVKVLQAELGIEPEPETTALFEAIRGGTTGQPAPTLPFSLSPTPAHNLPPDPTPFIGREPELAQIAERLADPACRLLTILGPGGMGKTRLAIQAARGATRHLRPRRLLCGFDACHRARAPAIGHPAGAGCHRSRRRRYACRASAFPAGSAGASCFG